MFWFLSLHIKCDAAVEIIFRQTPRDFSCGSFLRTNRDACEISFVMDDENLAIFEIWVISVEKPLYPYQIFGLFLRNSYELRGCSLLVSFPVGFMM
jgi:hypothetical protein